MADNLQTTPSIRFLNLTDFFILNGLGDLGSGNA